MNVMLHPVPVPDLAARFIAKPLQLLIGDAWVNAKSGKTFDVFDPATGLPIAKAAEGDAADIDAAVAAARRAFESGPWARMSPLTRSKLIYRLGDALEANAEINTHNFGGVALPFGGYKESGWGREMGKEMLELYTETKALAAAL
jgi:phenylacetaldehyde dehydrogenase